MEFISKINLQLFAAGTAEINPVNVTTQTTTGKDMSATMKVFYQTTLLENAHEEMIFSQLGKKQPIHGNKVEWRKFNTFAKALTPLTEGVIPTGKNFGMTKIEAETTQHGDYVTISDRLELEAYDDQIFGATEEMGAAEGETYDTLTRNIIVAGNSVAYCPKSNGTAVAARANLDATAVLTPDMVARAATWLKKNHAPKFEGGTYVAVIHPSVAYDLMATDEWKEFVKYTAAVDQVFKGEIGTLYGVRFIEATNAPVFKDGTIATYATLFMGKDAFGVVEPEGEGMELIIKDKGTIGGPLEQFSTIGYKFCHGAKILYQDRILRVESGSAYSAVDEAN